MGTKHLTEADRLRARTLFFDAGLPKARICQITGFSLNQVKLAIREKTPKTRSGRPPRRRPSAAAAAAASGVAGEPPVSIAQGVNGPEAVGEHSGHGEQGEDSSLILVRSTAATPSLAMDEAAAAAAGANSGHRPDDRMPSLHQYGQQQQQQQHQQQHPHHHDHHAVKWEPEYHAQAPYYSSWTQPALGSPNSVVGGHRGSVTPASPPLPPPTIPIRMLPTVAPLGIPSSYASAKGRGDGGVGSANSRDGRSSEGHDFSSSTSSSSLASSATSYSSMSSSASGGGFSLPSILASATGP